MHINQTYRRESAKQIAERLRDGQPGTPVFTSEITGSGKHITTLDALADRRRKQFA